MAAVRASIPVLAQLARPEEALGFRPVPAPESHTRINRPERQSYFLPYAARLDLNLPVILVGGNRDVDRLEQVQRETPAGIALDTLLWGRRPA